MEAGVGVLLGVGHPDEDVDERQDALGLLPVLDDPRVEVGQVEQDQTVQAPRLTVRRGPVTGADVVALADGEPVQQLSGVLLAPHRGDGA